MFTQLVLILAERGFITLDVEYIDGTKIESKANKYTFVWKKTVVKNRAKLQQKIRALLSQIDDAIAQENAAQEESVDFTPAQLTEICEELRGSIERASAQKAKDKAEKARLREPSDRPRSWRSNATNSTSTTGALSRWANATRCPRPTPTRRSCARRRTR